VLRSYVIAPSWRGVGANGVVSILGWFLTKMSIEIITVCFDMSVVCVPVLNGVRLFRHLCLHQHVKKGVVYTSGHAISGQTASNITSSLTVLNNLYLFM